MDADQLVQRALDSMKGGDFAQARDLLKKAATLAPLRADIREMLVYALEKESAKPRRKTASVSGEPSRAERHAPLSISPPRRERSSRFLAVTVLLLVGIVVVAVGAAIGVAYFQRRGVFPVTFAAPKRPVQPQEPTPTPFDPASQRRERLVAQAESLAGQAKFEEAIQALQEALKSAPPDPAPVKIRMAQMQMELGKRHYEGKRYAEAIEFLQQAVESDPASAECRFWLGQSHYFKALRESGARKRKDLVAAEQALKEARRLDPKMLKACIALAETCIKQGNPVEGAAYYKEIVEIDPSSPEAERARKQLKTMDAQ